ncbi:MFS transporter [Bradyrhizobium diazoefficiens]
MSVVGIDTGFELGAAPSVPDEISRRLEAMPGSPYVWRLVILLSLGGCFEIYDLFLTGYIAPGLSRSGLLSTTTQAFFGFAGIGAFVAATFAGLFVGTFFLGFLADRFGRARDLHLCAARLHRGLRDHGLPDLSGRSAVLAFPRRHRHRRRGHHHRRLHH